MINTIQIKKAQLVKGFYTTGSGAEVILLLGSCRSVPYLNYLSAWNNQNLNRFTIHFIDPFNWHWDLSDNRVDFDTAISLLETSPAMLEMLKSVKYFIHEYYANAGMFNVFKEGKNIYQFGMNAEMDITMPNFNDIFILTADIVAFDMEAKKMAIQDYNVIQHLSPQTLEYIDSVRQKNLTKFYDICAKTDFPEFADIFKDNYKATRYFWNFNHIAQAFSLNVLKLMNEKFLKLNMTEHYLTGISRVDMYANNFTYLTKYDEGYSWGEEIKPLKY